MEPFLSPTEVSKMLKVSRPWPYLMVKRGILPYYKMGKVIRFKTADIEEYIERCRIEKRGILNH
jgi:excisionase family DNA binding protein